MRSGGGSALRCTRVDVICAPDGFVLLELEAIEPSLYFDEAPGVAERLADAILARGRSA